jgi:hypothetical protein
MHALRCWRNSRIENRTACAKVPSHQIADHNDSRTAHGSRQLQSLLDKLTNQGQELVDAYALLLQRSTGRPSTHPDNPLPQGDERCIYLFKYRLHYTAISVKPSLLLHLFQAIPCCLDSYHMHTRTHIHPFRQTQRNQGAKLVPLSCTAN